MSRIDPQLETRISRSLDGELTAEEQASLYRELLRDPGANDVLSTSARYDQLAREALETVISGGGGVSGEALEQARRVRVGRMRLVTRWGSMAAALALLATVAWVAYQWSGGSNVPVGSIASNGGNGGAGVMVEGERPVPPAGREIGGESQVVPVAHIEPEPREYVGVVSDDRVYWIELTTSNSEESLEVGDF
jgi:hypothetical protein